MPRQDLTSPEAGFGPVPEDNQPGHHPAVEQDKPTGPPPGLKMAPAAERFGFRFEPLMLPLAAPFGVLPATTSVEVGEDVVIRFGPWRMRFPRADVTGVEQTTDYKLIKVAGPPHLSFADRGITFATNRQAGLCIQLARPHRGIDPLGLLRHPGATVTVDDIDGLAEALLRDR